MTEAAKKQKILDFIGTQLLGVVASVNEQGKPEAALVAFSETKDLELIFGTSHQARKYQNLQNDPHIAFVIGHDFDERITVQYEGEAEEVKGPEVEQCREIHLKKNPRSKKYADTSEQRWFKVTPTWIRYTNLNTSPPEEFEVKVTT